MTADIIPFPKRPAPATDTAADPQSQRLATALGGLEAALAAQRNAIADWRTQIARLHDSMASLSQSVQNYNTTLDALATRAEGN